MESKNLGTSIAIYACAAISLLLVLSGSSAAMLSFLLIIVMNVLGYNLVKKKYEKYPERCVLTSTNDTFLLYLCKLGGCFSISFLLSFIYASQREEIYANTVVGMIIILIIILFNVTPSKTNTDTHKNRKNGKERENGQKGYLYVGSYRFVLLVFVG